MNEVRRLIADLADSVALYDAHIPQAQGEWRRDLIYYRDFNLRMIGELEQLLVRQEPRARAH